LIGSPECAAFSRVAERERGPMTDKTRNLLLWGVSGAVGVGFIASGIAKFAMPAEVAKSFAHFGLPTGLAPFIAICEIAGGIGVLIPRLAGFAGLGLMVIMIGAVYSHLSHDPPEKALGALVMGVMAATVMVARGIRLGSDDPA
jgi:putative oxidoreductase